MHQGFESNDTVIANYQAVTQKLSEGWSAPGAGAFDTTPAVVHGVVYVGDEAGNFDALSETTGQSVFTISVGSAIESSPAVDSGTVFFGDDAGVVHAVNASTGARVWSRSVTGQVSTPVVVGGVVYVGTANGALVALDESTGAVNWTVPPQRGDRLRPRGGHGSGRGCGHDHDRTRCRGRRRDRGHQLERHPGWGGDGCHDLQRRRLRGHSSRDGL